VTLGPHAAFIVAAYSAGIIVIAGLIAWVVRDYAVQKRALAELEGQGIKRRSQAGNKDKP
jgi:heme exporter protein D